ncbi:TMPRSS15 [Branchiostoma lanceolatum]|uniref:TMPRSS15 protein n=1 Tax=Branchiostoma lanceolatum TaxID=7740 RepID=A0A8J9ZPK9_BRALA|nr:TMPRSS15 [Branchiostoma lanceolatum]
MLGLVIALVIVGEQGQGLSQSVSANISVFPILPCDFEEGTTCQWVQGVGDNFDWTLHSGGTPSGFTGPSYDHTKGNGQY